MTALAISPINGNRLGGLEIRRFVQKYMGIGLGVSVAVHLMMLGSYQIVNRLLNHETPHFISIPMVLNPLPPPPIDAPTKDPLHYLKPIVPVVPIAVLPKPIAGEAPPDAPIVPRQDEISQYLNDLRDSLKQVIGDEPIAIIQPIPDDDVIPPSDTFIPREIEPRLASMIQPEYPAIAKSAGVPGQVWVQFYVDKNGDVSEVRIMKSVPTGLGFEEETFKAVKQWKFTPAIQDKHPVGVWVGQTIVFKIQ
jgi:periplasmic protein TonB